MFVETYEVPEVMHDGSTECEAEAVALIESLGLDGQRSLIKKDDSGNGVRAPYRKMTLEEKTVYKAILPRSVSLAKYSDGVIPLRVLQVAAHAKELYDHVQVWCPENADDPDPLLVGLNGTDYSPRETFILARWGEVLVPFAELSKKACGMIRDARRNAIQKIMAECEAALARADSIPDSVVLQGKCKEPSFYGL